MQHIHNVEVVPHNYPAPLLWSTLSSVLGSFMMPLTIGILFGDQLCGMADVPVPSLLKTLQEHRMNVILGFWAVNMLVTSMSNTGAFEITYNGNIIFSKLAAGRTPTLTELFEKLNVLGLSPPSGTPSGGGSTFSLPTQ